MTTEHPHEGTPGSSPAGPPPRRRSTLVAVAVAAAVLLAGGGGAYWASTAADGGDGTGSSAGKNGSPPPLKLDGYGPGSGSGDGNPGIAPGEPDPSGVTYRAKGPLPDGPDSAPVYRPQGDVTRAQAERLAKALDVPGAPRLDHGSWKFGVTRDAAGPTLTVGKKAPGTWTYARYGNYGTGGGTGCAEPPAPQPKDSRAGKDSGASSPARCPAPGEPKRDGADPVSEQAAKKAVAPVLKGIGLSGAKLDASQTLGAIRTVNANPMLDKLPTYGWHTGLQVGADGQIVGGSGHLAPLRKGADYPVFGAGEALARLNKSGGSGTVGIAGCATPVPLTEDSAVSKPEARPCLPANGAQPKKTPVPVRGAVFGLAIHFVDGREALVPSWMFEVEQPGATGPQRTFTVTYPAVRQKYLARPTDKPTPEPAEPGTGAARPVHIESYGIDGRTLSLHFWGGVCDDYSAAAEVTDGTVKAKVTAKERKPHQVCIKIAKHFTEKVTLEKPLDGRKVVDASTGHDVPKLKDVPKVR